MEIGEIKSRVAKATAGPKEPWCPPKVGLLGSPGSLKGQYPPQSNPKPKLTAVEPWLCLLHVSQGPRYQQLATQGLIHLQSTDGNSLFQLQNEDTHIILTLTHH